MPPSEPLVVEFTLKEILVDIKTSMTDMRDEIKSDIKMLSDKIDTKVSLDEFRNLTGRVKHVEGGLLQLQEDKQVRRGIRNYRKLWITAGVSILSTVIVASATLAGSWLVN